MHPVSDEGRMRRYGGASTPKPAIELTMNINFTLLAQALAFAGLIWIIATKIWPPLMNAIEERQQKIAEGLAAADRSEAFSNLLLALYDRDRKSTRLNSSHSQISYAVFCLKKKKKITKLNSQSC